jgi:hypothetical protein
MTDCFVVIIESGNEHLDLDLLSRVQHKADLVVTDGRITKSRVPDTQIGAEWNPALRSLLLVNRKILQITNANDLRMAWRVMEGFVDWSQSKGGRVD